MNKNDISDAMDYLDEDMIRHTETLRRKWEQQKKESRLKREWRSFGAAAAACLVLFLILIVLVVVTIGRRASVGQEEGGGAMTEGMTAEGNGASVTEGMTAEGNGSPVTEGTAAKGNGQSAPEGDAGGNSEEFVSIDSLLAAGDGTVDMELAQVVEKVELGDYAGLYEAVASAGSEVLSDSIGTEVSKVEVLSESTGVEVSVVYYRVAGHTDLQYLIRRQVVTGSDGDGGTYETDTFSFMKFLCFDSEEYAYSEVLSLVYQIDSAEDIAEILVKPSKADNTDAGKALQEQIGERTVTDVEEIAVFYEVLSSLTCYGSDRWDLIDLGNGEVAADSAANEDYFSSVVWLGRYLTITTDYGNEIDGLKYTAYSDMFYEFNGIAYSTLTEEQAEKICEILGIEVSHTVSDLE
ncbi:MAG: hypothetical protein LUE16_10645 [Lachnospiraceae bacterium]|nr:hypothetical protein [Lachnospiraceae bacterium]